MDLGPGLACPTLAVARSGLRSTERNSLETHWTTPKTRFKIIENPISGAFFRVLPTLLLQSLMVVGSKRRRKQPASFSASTWCQVMPAVELIDLDYLDVFTSCEPFQVAVEETTEVCGLVKLGRWIQEWTSWYLGWPQNQRCPEPFCQPVARGLQPQLDLIPKPPTVSPLFAVWLGRSCTSSTTCPRRARCPACFSFIVSWAIEPLRNLCRR